MAVAGITLAVLFVLSVVLPAVLSGGLAEFLGVAAVFAVILLVERVVRGH